MRIAIVNNQAPFVRGGAELLAEWLHDKLEEYGHEARDRAHPVPVEPPGANHRSHARGALVRLANVDRVVAFKFPAYYVPHENKVLWLLHQFRQAYDLWGTPLPGHSQHPHRSPHSRRDRRRRSSLPRERPKHIYTNSKIVGRRLRSLQRDGVRRAVPPLFDATPYRCEEYGDYFFFPSRITAGKRQHLAVQAMARTERTLGW